MRSSSSAPQVAPWPHWTSSAKISSSGFASASAPSKAAARRSSYGRRSSGVGRHVDAALEDRAGLVVDDGLEELTALAGLGVVVTTSVVSAWRRPDSRVTPRKPPTASRPAKRAKIWAREMPPPSAALKVCRTAFVPMVATTVERLSASTGSSCRRMWSTCGAVTDGEDRHDVGLVGGDLSGLDAFDDGHLGAGLDDDHVAHRGRDGGRAVGHVGDLDRAIEIRAGGHADHHAVRHEGRVQLDGEIGVGGRQGFQSPASPAASASASGRNREPRRQIAEFGNLGHERPLATTRRRAPSPGTAGASAFTRATSAGPAAGAMARTLERRSVYFHSSTRRCGRPTAVKRVQAASRAARTASVPGRASFSPGSASGAPPRPGCGGGWD